MGYHGKVRNRMGSQSVKVEHQRLMGQSPVRQMQLFGLDPYERSLVQMRHNMYLLENAIDNVAYRASRMLDAIYLGE